MIGLERGTVADVPSDDEWPAAFAQERHCLCKRIRHLVLDIQHVGSTAVPGLAARPILDLAVAVASPADVQRCCPSRPSAPTATTAVRCSARSPSTTARRCAATTRRRPTRQRCVSARSGGAALCRGQARARPTPLPAARAGECQYRGAADGGRAGPETLLGGEGLGAAPCPVWEPRGPPARLSILSHPIGDRGTGAPDTEWPVRAVPATQGFIQRAVLFCDPRLSDRVSRGRVLVRRCRRVRAVTARSRSENSARVRVSRMWHWLRPRDTSGHDGPRDDEGDPP
jgi:GrpB-like predicted nucleotidyltransferase (UPF0157 family)